MKFVSKQILWKKYSNLKQSWIRRYAVVDTTSTLITSSKLFDVIIRHVLQLQINMLESAIRIVQYSILICPPLWMLVHNDTLTRSFKWGCLIKCSYILVSLNGVIHSVHHYFNNYLFHSVHQHDHFPYTIIDKIASLIFKYSHNTSLSLQGKVTREGEINNASKTVTSGYIRVGYSACAHSLIIMI